MPLTPAQFNYRFDAGHYDGASDTLKADALEAAGLGNHPYKDLIYSETADICQMCGSGDAAVLDEDNKTGSVIFCALISVKKIIDAHDASKTPAEEQPTPGELEALLECKRLLGRTWKSKLNAMWLKGDYGVMDRLAKDLQNVRNRLGPAWLHDKCRI